MRNEFSIANILKLDVSERIQLVEDVWDSVAAVPEAIPLTDKQKKELDRRLAAYHNDPSAGSPWKEVKKKNFVQKMKYDLIIRPEAEQDMQGAFGWYEDRVSGLGREFLRSVDASIAQINRTPITYPVIYQGIRRMLTRRFPFGVFYIVVGQKNCCSCRTSCTQRSKFVAKKEVP